MTDKKRGGGRIIIDDESKTKRQRKSKSNIKQQHPKSSTIIPHADTPLPSLLPHQRIDLIANLCESILEDPIAAVASTRTTTTNNGNTHPTKDDANNDNNDDSNQQQLYTKTPSKLTTLLHLASPPTNGYDNHAARLSLISLLAVYQDILPSYRIRLPTATEMAVKVSKDIKQTWDYERRLLNGYQMYLTLLEKTWEGGRYGNSIHLTGGDSKNSNKRRGGGGTPTTLAATSIIALSTLLQTNYNFNFRSNILTMVISCASHTNDEIRYACCSSLKIMFDKDASGEASLEAVKRMGKVIKDGIKKFNSNGGRSVSVYKELLDCWMFLPLRVHEDEAAAAKLATKIKNKRAKKSQQEKDMLEIERELQEGDATLDKIDVAKNQAEMLHTVTMTYFRILRDCCGGNEGNDGNGKKNGMQYELLPVCLRGLAKFSHLIHLDAISDLMEVLKDLLKESHNLPLEASINCILCALKTLKGPGQDAIPTDPKEYLIPLYNEISRLGVYNYQSAAVDNNNSNNTASNSNSNSNMDPSIEAAIRCIDHAFTQRRELSASRLCAFLKRIVSTSMHCPPHSSTPLIASARQMALRYASSSKVQHMFENEEEIVSEGMFTSDASDPEHSNAHATSLWELSLLKFHVNPMVADHAVGMANNTFLKLPGESPLSIGDNMGRNVNEGYIAHRAIMKRHPLETKKLPVKDDEDEFGTSTNERKKKRQQRRNQNQVRFITPRKTGSWHLLEPTSVSML